jgi:hypothetical protein
MILEYIPTKLCSLLMIYKVLYMNCIALGKDKKQAVAGVDRNGDTVVMTESSQAQLMDDVLVISLGVHSEPPGMLPEHKVGTFIV